jgi:diadenosine tetraphosphatase ApaH/serine/threonine PP2A family protein phosphatase
MRCRCPALLTCPTLPLSVQQLPLFTIVNKSVIVLHGGLFHTQDASLAELDSIDRCAFSLQDLPEGGETLQPVPRTQRVEYLRQLVRDALWSDPVDEQGIMTSVRGELGLAALFAM